MRALWRVGKKSVERAPGFLKSFLVNYPHPLGFTACICFQPLLYNTERARSGFQIASYQLPSNEFRQSSEIHTANLD